MQKALRPLISAGILMTMLFVACTRSTPPPPEPAASLKPSVFSANLLQTGLDIRSLGAAPETPLKTRNELLLIQEEKVQIFTYPSAVEAEMAVRGISPDASTIDGQTFIWAATPHFFAKGEDVVFYAGDSEAVITLLTGLLGPQVAGR